MISDFTSGSRLAARWYYVEGAFQNICATQGASFLGRLRIVLGLPAGGTWDDSVQAQLIAQVASRAQSDASWQTVLTALQQDAANRQVSEMSTRTGIWLTYYRSSGRRFDGILFDPGTVFPVWGMPPENDRGFNGGQIVCYDATVDTDPVLIPASDLARATANSVTGVRIEAGRLPPQSSISVVSGGPGTVSPLTVIAISVLIVGIGALFFQSSKPRTK